MPKGKVIEARPKKRKQSQKAEEPASTNVPHNRGSSQTLHSTMDRVRFNKVKSRAHSEKHSHDLSIGGKYQKHILLSAVLVCIAGAIFGFGLHHYKQWRKASLVRNPINLPTVISKDTADDNLFWGTYRPGLYFGMKHRSPNPLMMGLIWTSQNPLKPEFRHLCDQNDGVLSYNWLEHDGRNFGVQQIVDVHHILTVSFVKQQTGTFGGDWSVRISAVSRNQTSPSKPLSVILYFYYMGEATDYHFHPIIEKDTVLGLTGSTSNLGEHQIYFSYSRNAMQTSSLLAHSPREDAVLDTLFSGIGLRRDTNMLVLMGRSPKLDKNVHPNIWFQEITVHPPVQDVTSRDLGTVVVEVEFTRSGSNGGHLLGSRFDEQIGALSEKFHERFVSRFPVDHARFNERQVNLSKIALSNLLGGIGYFHGRSLIESVHTGQDPVENWFASLYTATPSRSMFPRGFLWDEGFHGLILAQWDPQLAMESVGHWLDLMNGDGWIAREQILGDEARSRVPAPFIVQRDTVANPPTLALVIESLIDNLPMFTVKETSEFRHWAVLVLPRLHAWYQWFNSTQFGQVPWSYRWRGRNPDEPHQLNPLTLSSGLDDYPRPSHPSELERHLDLRCWMTMFARVISRLASLVAQYAQTEPSPARLQKLEQARTMAAQYGRYADLLSDMDNLDQLHWSESAERYADFGLHTDSVRLQSPELNPEQQALRPDEPPKPVRVVDKPPSLQLLTSSFGYVNLFPLLLRIIPPSSPRLSRLLADIGSSDLWTDFGIRSLSPSSPFYHKGNTKDDPPYWRGAIWINMNYLVVRGLRYYATHPRTPTNTAEEASRLYKKLSENLVSNVLGELERTGNLWEQYNDITGRGQRGHPFSGWTSLVTLMMN